MRGEYGREEAGCDDGTSALTGHLSAGCGGRRCCNVLRKLASFVWDRPTPQQLQLRLFYTKTAGKSHIKMYQQIIAYGWSPNGQCIFQELEVLQYSSGYDIRESI